MDSIMRFVFIILFCVIAAGCRTTQSTVDHETESALKSVAGAVKGSPLTDSDLKKLNKQMREDKDAQSAVSTITNSMSGKEYTIKYCPKDGKRFAGSVQVCPEHNVELRWVDE
jgi:hypothetical protein